MKIIADPEAVELLTKVTDALLKAYWNDALWLTNKLLAKTEHSDLYDIEVKKEKVEKKEEIKEKKTEK